MFKFNSDIDRTVVNIYCDHCKQRLTDIEMSAVLFNYKTGECWQTHKGNCHDALEKLHQHPGKKAYCPWWEMDFFIEQLGLIFKENGWKNPADPD